MWTCARLWRSMAFSSDAMEKLLIGTRGSALSIAQTEIVARKIGQAYPDIKCELIRIKTLNEKIDRSAENATDKDIYTREIDAALVEGSIDIAVHSLKDLKNELNDGIILACVPERDSPFDCIIKGKGFESKDSPVIGTSSIRRRVQVFGIIKNATVKELHGNVDTRLKALGNGSVDALVLAESGMRRLGYSAGFEELGADMMVPAIGQGALAITARANDGRMLEMMKSIGNKKAEAETSAERAFGRVFGIGCDVPIGALALADEAKTSMKITGFLSDIEGKKQVRKSIEGSLNNPEELGRELGKRVMEDGGEDIIAGNIKG